jgi:hypothetical protein
VNAIKAKIDRLMLVKALQEEPSIPLDFED